ncbi:MAG TPA: ATP-binding protein [Bryobacteraceae bacterium]|jgi:hypothetical protein
MSVDIVSELSGDRLAELIRSNIEMESLDFKESLDLASLRGRAELAKDVLAMANTFGGHLLIGFEDRTHELVGISHETEGEIRNSESLNDKLRRYCGSHITVYSACHVLPLPTGGSATCGLIYIPPFEGPGGKVRVRDMIVAIRLLSFWIPITERI